MRLLAAENQNAPATEKNFKIRTQPGRRERALRAPVSRLVLPVYRNPVGRPHAGCALDVRLRGVCTERLYFIVLEFSTQVFWAGR